MDKKLTILDLLPVTAPGILSPEMKSDMGRFLPDGAGIRHVQIEEGSVTIECEYDEAFSAPQVIKLAMAEAEKGGVDGVFVNCFGDPGVRAVREVLKVPVFGGFEPAIYLALGLGDTVGIVTVLRNVVPMIRGAIARAGLEAAYIGPEGFEARLSELLAERGIGLVVLAGFLRILSPEFVSGWAGRMLNIHPSLIPAFCGEGYYGLRVHEAALRRGVKLTGATVHFVNEIPDGGEIILQQAVPVLPGDTPESLQRRVMEQAEWKLLPEAVERVARDIERSEKA